MFCMHQQPWRNHLQDDLAKNISMAAGTKDNPRNLFVDEDDQWEPLIESLELPRLIGYELGTYTI